jgi:hypothetical protein
MRWNGETHGLEVIRVERVDGSQIELSTTVRLPEEARIQWSTTVDCGSHRILAQQRTDLALGLWPFPGVFEGQQLDFVTEDARFTVPARRRGSPPRSVALTYGTYAGRSAGRTRVVRANDQGRTTEFDVAPGTGPVEVRFADDSTLELIGAAHAAALEMILSGEDEEGRANNPGLWPLGDPARMQALNRTGAHALTAGAATAGTANYLGLCLASSSLTYDGHWPEQIFTTKTGSAASSTTLAGDDFTALHDDRDSEFLFAPDDAQFAQQFEQAGQTLINVEWESAAWFPRHIILGGNYPDGAGIGVNHFVYGACDTSFQSPLADDRLVVRGAAIVDCGHSPLLEIHPPSALYWRHRFQTGIADFFFRASSYGWHPHIEQFSGAGHAPLFGDPQLAGSQGSFEADLDIPDMDQMVPGQAPRMGPIVVDYAVSGYDVIDDAHSLDDGLYGIDHPAAHLAGGDYSQPISKYFEVSVTQNGSTFHVHAKPNPPFDQTADPARPALIGFRFRACVPVNDAAGNSLNGCLPDDPLDISANDWIGQAIPARLGETITGHFYDRHRPSEPLTFEVRAFADTCDNGHTEAYLGTVTVTPPNFEFSFPLPAAIYRICTPTSPGTPANEPIDGILLRPLVASDRQGPCGRVMYSYFVPGTCVSPPESIVKNGQCPPGTGFTGSGYFLCGGPLEPYCKPGATGQPGVPGVPTGVTATGGANQITVSWQPVPMAAAYQVHTSSGAVVSRLRDTSVTFTGLANGLTQSYYVTGLNPDPAGEGPPSAVVTATTVHCSQNCAGCCTGETCSSVATPSNGCKINGAACGPACPANVDACSNGVCVCHQADWQVCNPTVGQADYHRSCGTYNNACGQPVSCGTCPASPNWSCTGGLSAHCVCTPYTASQVCGACGTYAADGCGGSVYCGACAPPPPTCGYRQRSCGDGTCVCSTCQCP